MYAGKLKTCSNIAWHRPQSISCRVDSELIEKSSRALSTTTDPLERLRLLCLTRGACGIMGLGRVFRIVSENDTPILEEEKFLYAIKETGLELTEEEAKEIFKRFDPDDSGHININEFMKNLRPPMSDNRRQILEQAFRKLDKSGHGLVTVEDLRKVYSVNANPRYKSGEETEEVILKKFLDNFETEGEADGKVTFEEFLNYYSGISVSVENDCNFDLMIRQSYKL